MSPARFITITEAALMVGYSVVTLRRWDRRGLLPNTKRGPGGRRIILLSDLRDVINGRGCPA